MENFPAFLILDPDITIRLAELPFVLGILKSACRYFPVISQHQRRRQFFILQLREQAHRPVVVHHHPFVLRRRWTLPADHIASFRASHHRPFELVGSQSFLGDRVDVIAIPGVLLYDPVFRYPDA